MGDISQVCSMADYDHCLAPYLNAECDLVSSNSNNYNDYGDMLLDNDMEICDNKCMGTLCELSAEDFIMLDNHFRDQQKTEESKLRKSREKQRKEEKKFVRNQTRRIDVLGEDSEDSEGSGEEIDYCSGMVVLTTAIHINVLY
jgi:hypothetical protein